MGAVSWFDVHLDCESELRAIADHISGGGSHLVLLPGDDGVGKSAFLAKALSDARGAAVSAVDLRGGLVDPGIFAWRVNVDLSLGAELFRNVAAPQTTLSLERSKLINSPISFEGAADNGDTRSIHLLEAAAALIVALGQPPDRPRVIAIDSYEDASTEFRVWLEAVFLQPASRAPSLVVLVAGREVPKPGPGWDCPVETRHLPPLAAIHVRELALRAEVNLSEEEASVIVDITNGHPGEVVDAVAKLVARRRGVTPASEDPVAGGIDA